MITDTSEIIGYLYRTKDYSIFKTHEENRDLENSHAKKIYENMIKNGWISGSVVAIGTEGKIYEGHYRIACAQKANVPIEYILVSEPIENLISELNMLRKGWSLLNHMKTYIIRGNQEYIKLGEFANKFPEFSLTDCIMLCKNTTSTNKVDEFFAGKFAITNLEKAYLWASQIRELKPYFSDEKGNSADGYAKGPFVRAMACVLLKPKFNFNEFLYKVKLQPKALKTHQTIKEYSLAIEEIYNYKRREKIYLRK